MREQRRGAFDVQYFIARPDLYPTLTDPRAIPAKRARFLDDHDEVVGVVVDGHARAYPLMILAHVHAVNDVIGKRPVLITACGICSSSFVADARVDGVRVTFNFEGIHHGTPVLYDTQTHSSWFHLDARCFRGSLRGTALTPLPGGRYTTWAEWRRAHPETDVVMPPRHLRSDQLDGVTAFRGSSEVPEVMAPSMGQYDTRMAPSDRVYGIEAGGRVVAYPIQTLVERRGVIDARQGTSPITVWLERRSEAVMAFDPRAQSKTLTFAWTRSGLVRDHETGSSWTFDGLCVRGPLAGTRLKVLRGTHAEWYGWSTSRPGTSVYAPA